MPNQPSKISDWEDNLQRLAEKYCKHDDRPYNSCLYYIFKPFIKNLLTQQRTEVLEEVLKELPKELEIEEVKSFLMELEKGMIMLSRSGFNSCLSQIKEKLLKLKE